MRTRKRHAMHNVVRRVLYDLKRSGYELLPVTGGGEAPSPIARDAADDFDDYESMMFVEVYDQAKQMHAPKPCCGKCAAEDAAKADARADAEAMNMDVVFLPRKLNAV